MSGRLSAGQGRPRGRCGNLITVEREAVPRRVAGPRSSSTPGPHPARYVAASGRRSRGAAVDRQPAVGRVRVPAPALAAIRRPAAGVEDDLHRDFLTPDLTGSSDGTVAKGGAGTHCPEPAAEACEDDHRRTPPRADSARRTADRPGSCPRGRHGRRRAVELFDTCGSGP